MNAYIVWSVMASDHARMVHLLTFSKREAEGTITAAFTEPTLSCGCCEGPSPAAILGIKQMFIETRDIRGEPDKEIES
jgi:hypothetical protein